MAGTAAYGFAVPALATVRPPEIGAAVMIRAAAEGGRAHPLARGGPAGGSVAPGTVNVQFDGLRGGTAPALGTVAEALAAVGIRVGGIADRVFPPAETVLLPGMQIAVDRGFPVTFVDGGKVVEARSQRATVGGFLSALAVSVGAADRVAQPLDQVLSPGDVVKVVRVADREVAEVAAYPFLSRVMEDPGLEFGRTVIQVRGVQGEVSETYLVRYVDGLEADRTLLSTVVLRSPITEVRRVGTRPTTLPPAPPEIDRIIRAAAARWGADPQQLLRVAYCESRYDAYAFNPQDNDSGLFQFIPGTWSRNSVRAGYGGASPFDAVASANTAAMMFAERQAWQWTCK